MSLIPAASPAAGLNTPQLCNVTSVGLFVRSAAVARPVSVGIQSRRRCRTEPDLLPDLQHDPPHTSVHPVGPSLKEDDEQSHAGTNPDCSSDVYVCLYVFTYVNTFV